MRERAGVREADRALVRRKLHARAFTIRYDYRVYVYTYTYICPQLCARVARKSTAQSLFVFRFTRAAGYDHRRDVIIRVLALSLRLYIRTYLLDGLFAMFLNTDVLKLHSIPSSRCCDVIKDLFN